MKTVTQSWQSLRKMTPKSRCSRTVKDETPHRRRPPERSQRENDVEGELPEQQVVVGEEQSVVEEDTATLAMNHDGRKRRRSSGTNGLDGNVSSHVESSSTVCPSAAVAASLQPCAAAVSAVAVAREGRHRGRRRVSVLVRPFAVAVDCRSTVAAVDPKTAAVSSSSPSPSVDLPPLFCGEKSTGDVAMLRRAPVSTATTSGGVDHRQRNCGPRGATQRQPEA
uniref:Uncharacterized protein n=1 Tax=Oryza sativa subsp. japonica TaxID=39947 RepID=Q5YLZ7_ORYSJ|nr:hypothetical protein [Oryza sativa Japonica Group]